MEELVRSFENDGIEIPPYLEKHYWWAYLRPWSIWTFERGWMINLILWGFYAPLRKLVLTMMGQTLAGKTIKISCCYGKLEQRLAERVHAGGGTLDIVDVSPEQLKNSYRKTDPAFVNRIVKHHRRDAVDLAGFADNSYDRALLFFLPHEQPRDVRKKTFEEAFRVVKGGGEIFVVEFAKSVWWHPLRYIWYPVLMVLEPFARDLWTKDIEIWLPQEGQGCVIEKRHRFGKFYQGVKIVTPIKVVN
ncbi:MAG: rhodoquinone biosynthesis methyltransferase RquA [Alphaproteobacteria bacterium]|nr:rhodoquinone biosynthesis methyltransferase RquA [Alphaproteobacteria bacterium]